VCAGEKAAIGERQACPEWLGPVNTPSFAGEGSVGLHSQRAPVLLRC
jgi:hypothetical protein